MATLERKVIAVTGAGSGIGLATAKLLFSRGASLSIADLRQEALDTAVQEIYVLCPTRKDRILAVAIDVSSSSQVNSWVDQTVAYFGHLDGAANLAGVIGPNIGVHNVTDLADDEWDFVIRVNLTGVFYCMRAQLRVINEGGSVVNAASTAGLEGNPRNANYSASKHGVVGLSKSAAKEVGGRGVRINCVAP
jgi:NAD(P)-dependent dehydrogenase (short-subunit alcohol dehydrogenase family)